jgi:hypothetical protein
VTRREVFVAVRDHLLSQGARSLRDPSVRPDEEDPADGSNCAYRGRTPDGTPARCAVGVLIPDGLYAPALEGASARFLCGAVEGRAVTPAQEAAAMELRLALPDVFRPSNAGLLEALQKVHDDAPPDVWATRLRHIGAALDGGAFGGPS